MILRGIDYGHVLNASGSRGFYGEGYWFHKFFEPFGLDYKGMTFVSKTTTIEPRKGNLDPNELFPKCVIVKFKEGVVLNAVGLTNPGTYQVISKCLRQPELYSKPFMISFTTVTDNKYSEMRKFVDFLKVCEDLESVNKMGIQLNMSCPNANTKRSSAEICSFLDMFSNIDYPIVVKLNALASIGLVRDITDHDYCDGIICSNTIPWGCFPGRINWTELFGTDVSPLQKFGGGGLSGKPLLLIARDWIAKMRDAGIDKPIIGGGGILSGQDADVLFDAGANAVEIGCAFILRPWRISKIINHINNRFNG
jgi:dihydroorotate dehydrogenase (NAD+) catalytic subunit